MSQQNQPAAGRPKGRTVPPKPAAGPLTAEITLAGQTYTVRELPVRPGEEWRKRLLAEFAVVGDVLGLVQGAQGDTPAELIKSLDLNLAAGMANSLMRTLMGSISTVMDLVFAFSPELAADRERIENAAYASEFIEALSTILRLAYPVGKLAGLFSGLGGRSTSKS